MKKISSSFLRRACSTAFLGGMLLTQAALAQTWTAPASACVPDEDSLALYEFTDGYARIKGGPSTAAVKLRCNVQSWSFAPLWNSLTLGWDDDIDSAGGVYSVMARLIQVPKNPALPFSVLATVTSNTMVGTRTVPLPLGYAWDFINNVYYVVIDLNRTNGSGAITPKAWFVGLQ